MWIINHDVNRYYKKHWLFLDSEIKAKLKIQESQNSDFCTKMQEIMDPILESFNTILEEWTNPILVTININKLINNILLLMLSELEVSENREEENWLFPQTKRKLIAPTLNFSKK